MPSGDPVTSTEVFITLHHLCSRLKLGHAGACQGKVAPCFLWWPCGTRKQTERCQLEDGLCGLALHPPTPTGSCDH
ncbi:hypothetical protein OJAV_G00055200 [Oryzias javanicus]|uniref:Uncharacterized protein n=1 Tax=Oryzias javanicus TaxID=123683 RepID=A0A437D9Q8_ORYJA|nr:hypothetical protein OJAV_G00055200 [Oryzias javanicus]